MLKRALTPLRRLAGYRRRRAALASLPVRDRELIGRVRSAKLTYLSEEKLASLAGTCRAIEDAQLPGIFIEAGCALGGSAILIASLKQASRPLHVYDVFGMIPAPGSEDGDEIHARYRKIAAGRSKGIGGDRYYGYQQDLLGLVSANFARFGIDRDARAVRLIKGLVRDTLQLDAPVAFAHIDVDWYDPVKTCLTRIFPMLVGGGSIILDDYHDWAGCRKATDEFLRGVAEPYALDDRAGSLKITKVPQPRP